jgi:hypothetical protein
MDLLVYAAEKRGGSVSAPGREPRLIVNVYCNPWSEASKHQRVFRANSILADASYRRRPCELAQMGRFVLILIATSGSDVC